MDQVKDFIGESVQKWWDQVWHNLSQLQTKVSSICEDFGYNLYIDCSSWSPLFQENRSMKCLHSYFELWISYHKYAYLRKTSSIEFEPTLKKNLCKFINLLPVFFVHVIVLEIFFPKKHVIYPLVLWVMDLYCKHADLRKASSTKFEPTSKKNLYKLVNSVTIIFVHVIVLDILFL